MEVIDTLARGLRKVDTLNIPWAAIALWQAAISGLAIAAIVHRVGHPLIWTTIAALFTTFPGLYYYSKGRRIPPVAAAPPLIIAVAILVWANRTNFDIAPFILVFGLGAVAAQHSTKVCAATASVFALILIAASITHRINNVALYLGLLLTALAVGHRAATERRLVAAERKARQSLLQHATGEERRRIAREIHDVVAHSLSITLLHLTGARRDLQYERASDEAITALLDAERLGRQAMADIRRTIGLLDNGPTSLTPEPGIADIATLVEDFRNAGLALNYHIDRHHEHVAPTTGLGVYRICQESFANIVKHSPSAKAHMALHISANTVCLTISNNLTHPPKTTSDAYGGAGIRGMKQRAELLGGQLIAGPQQSHWTVNATIPIPDHELPIQ